MVVLQCADGALECPASVLELNSPVLRDMLSKDATAVEPDKLALPFKTEEVRAALSILGSREPEPPVPFDMLPPAARVLDFLGSTRALEATMLRRWSLLGGSESYERDLLEFLADTLRYNTAKHVVDAAIRQAFFLFPFWSEFKERVIPKYHVSPDVAVTFIRALRGLFAPSWVIAEMLIKLPHESCTPAFLLDLMGVPWGLHCHASELGDVLALFKAACSHDDWKHPVFRMLANFEVAAGAGLFFPLGSTRASGSLLLYDNPVYASIVVDLTLFGRNNALRRICRGVHLAISEAGELSACIRLKLLDSQVVGTETAEAAGQQLRVRMAACRGAALLAEEWIVFDRPSPVEGPARYIVRPGSGCCPGGQEGRLARELGRAGSATTLRADLFYDRRPFPVRV